MHQASDVLVWRYDPLTRCGTQAARGVAGQDRVERTSDNTITNRDWTMRTGGTLITGTRCGSRWAARAGACARHSYPLQFQCSAVTLK